MCLIFFINSRSIDRQDRQTMTLTPQLLRSFDHHTNHPPPPPPVRDGFLYENSSITNSSQDYKITDVRTYYDTLSPLLPTAVPFFSRLSSFLPTDCALFNNNIDCRRFVRRQMISKSENLTLHTTTTHTRIDDRYQYPVLPILRTSSNNE